MKRALTHTFACLLSWTALACGSTTQNQPPVAITDAPAPAPVERTLALTLSAAATPLALACQREEPALANGVDDDCDGRIDGAPARGDELLSVSLVRAADLDVAIALRDGNGQIVAPAHTRSAGSCDAAAAFALTRADYAALAPGSYELVITRGHACESKQAPFAHVSLWAAKAQNLAVGVSVADEPVVIATAVVR